MDSNVCTTSTCNTPGLIQSQTESVYDINATTNVIHPHESDHTKESYSTTPSISVRQRSIPSSSLVQSTTSSCELIQINQSEEARILNQNGYQKIKTLHDTQQGELFDASVLKPSASDSKVTIKRVSKALHFQRIATPRIDDDGMKYCIPNDIFKETLILSRLTVANKWQYIIQFIEFFQSKKEYYLVLQHLGDKCMNLKQFVELAHKYIRNGQLHIRKYLQMIKFLFWQLFVTMRRLHDDMRCCHLDLKLEHVMLKDAEFVINPKTKVVTISRAPMIQLCDFGSAELFEDEVFECNKQSSVLREAQYQSPLVSDGKIYDARKADIWALGSMLWHCLIGQPMYSQIQQSDEIEQLLLYGLNAGKMRSCADLLRNMLKINEDERYLAMDILKHKWFKTYFRKYEHRIGKKKIVHLKRFPYYNLNQVMHVM
eukprot:84534_1